MTKEETARLLATINVSYPNMKVEDKRHMIDAWHFMLDEYDVSDVLMAFKTYVKTTSSAFPPSVSQLIGMIHKPSELAQMNEGEAWALVRNAIARSSYYAEEEFAKLPPEIQQAIGSSSQLHSWAMDEDFNESVVASNFQRAFKTVQKRNSEISRMPVEMQEKFKRLKDTAIYKMERLDG